ncbi:von Willebrand factor type A domain protein [Ruminiclostridium hungatei]|uniref:von Willebrand factor type A domain protein n=1 Tax=Ruminiclostridium hungatei TaxID=48256 RepID=A0A1V4SKU9_RUMHU|nr:VWA domain-containing protein [Ruminiclostridium hungatei]OPX44480.1 von Willebrand factor type A domain protein [Ruminiclostridium hungatei]
MGLSFERPYLLVLIPVLLGLVILSIRWLKRMNRNKKTWITVLRCAVLALLILALSGTSLTWKLNNVTTLFLIDASDSTLSGRSQMEQFIREAYKLKGPKDKLGVISFGDNAQVESFVSDEASFSKIEGRINGNYTNIENALATSLSLLPGNSNKRVVLLSDGEENSGSAARIAMSLQEQDIDFKYYKVEKNTGEEALVEKIEVPERLALDEEFNLVVTINSTTVQQAKLTLVSDRTKLSEQTVQLQKGTNKFVFRDRAVSGGFKSYNVLIEPEKDSLPQNNEASAFTNIVAKPKILVLEDQKGEAEELIKMLKASSMDYTLVDAKAAPGNVQDMNAYKTIITCNVQIDNLNSGFKNSLESYVKDFGGGFIATGGDNSFALGGYSKTPLEKVLPVYMDMRGKKEAPKMALLLIIDKSGSMSEGVAGISKVDMAKEGAIRSLESLRAGKDEIGVLSLDGAYSWVVKRQIINDPKAIEEDIGSIRADGGTSIIPSLKAAYESLKESDAKIKHIILLTDGLAERVGYDSLLQDINKESITVSTVAVGQDSDKALLSMIANSCSGRFYVTDAYSNIPSIFTKETFMAARTYLNNREFTPVINYEHSVLKGVAEGGLPSLLGYVGASQKETARVVLRSDEEDPILTVWQYGLGKAVAWNSDVTGKWSSNYIPWEKNIKLWQNIINFTVENYNNENASLEISQQGSKATVTLKNKTADNELNTKATVLTPSGETVEAQLNPVAPGEYSGTFDIKEDGVYMVSGKQEKNGELVNALMQGHAVQYSPEYKINSGDNMEKLTADVGGKLIKEPEEVFAGDIRHKTGQRDLTAYLISMFLILFMLDIALRRLNLNVNRLRAAAVKLGGRFYPGRSPEAVSKAQSKPAGGAYKNVKPDLNEGSRQGTSRPVNPAGSYENIDRYSETAEREEQKKAGPDMDETGRTEPRQTDTLDTSQLLKRKKFK